MEIVLIMGVIILSGIGAIGSTAFWIGLIIAIILVIIGLHSL